MEPKKSKWRRIFGPLPKTFWGDVAAALAVLAGAALGAWTFDAWDVFFPGSVIGAGCVVIVRTIIRGVKRLRARGPLA